MNFRPSYRLPLQASALLIALTLAACGGGGGDAPSAAIQTQSAQQTGQQASASTATDTSAQTARSTSTGASSSTGTSTAGTLARSGRSLNWWGTPPLELFNVNQTCSPQPSCRIPDGDLAVWNATCAKGDLSCYVPLSTEPQVAPLPRSDVAAAI